MSLAPTGIVTALQPVGSVTVAAGSSHILECFLALLVIVITSIWFCCRRICRWFHTGKSSIRLPSGFEVTIRGAVGR